MGFFNRLFGSAESEKDQPEIEFGRFSDAYKPKDRYEAWDESLSLFNEEKYSDSFNRFFEYLKRENEENVFVTEDNGKISFTLYQGSKQIEGFIDDEHVKVEAKIAKSRQLNIGFLRRMMEMNFMLKYSRFALDENNNLTIVFDSYLLDGSPYKLYYALKEVSVNADKLDDILIDEFDSLEPINMSHTEPLNEHEKAVKVAYIKRVIKETLDAVDQTKLNIQQYPGGIAYILLSAMYKLDYLVAPHGPMMEKLERIHRSYFAKDGKSVLQKVLKLKNQFAELGEKNDEELEAELYTVISTFGITSPASHKQLKSFIEGELPNINWYLENKHYDVAINVPTYIVGFTMFNYAVPLPVRAFFHLLYEVLEFDYFKELGFKHDYVGADGVLKHREIKSAISSVTDKFREKHPKLKPKTSDLKFDTHYNFAHTFLKMIYELDLSEDKNRKRV